LRVLDCGSRIVNRARPDDHGEPVVGAVQDGMQRAPSGGDSSGRGRVGPQLARELCRRDERLDALDAQIVGSGLHRALLPAKPAT
jgi:hypothetical protein